MVLLITALLALTQASGLQIRVLAGEDAVNIVQQKTAVAPLIEVRDKNGLPVSGVAVTFSIQGANVAAFPGAVSTLTAVTNLAGQATVAAVNPLAAGAFSIEVQAAFQGQTAVAMIAQSNVMTLAEAAATAGSAASTAGASAGAGAAGGGGGISATTLGIAGAAVGGGAIIATQVANSDPTPLTATPPTVTRTLTGSIAGTLVHNISFPAGGSPCTIDHAVRLDANVSITITNDSVTGTFRWSGTDAQVAATCGGVGQFTTGSIAGDAPLSGTTRDITFRRASPPSTTPTNPPGSTASSETIASFTGAWDGTTLTGTFTFERTIVVRDTAGTATQNTFGRVAIPVTLR